MPSSNNKKRQFSPQKPSESMKKVKTTNMDKTNEYLKQILSNNQKLIAEIKHQNENYNKQFNAISDGLKTVNSHVTSLEAANCSRSLNIIGIPVMPNESTASLLKTLKKVCGALNVAFTEKEVDDIYRIGTEKMCIKVDFTTKIKRRELVKDARSCTIVGRDIVVDSSDGIFVNEFLSRENFALHREAKEPKKKGIVKYVWIDNGRVLVKKRRWKTGSA